MKIGRCEVAERSSGLPHKKTRAAGLVPAPIFPKIGRSLPKLPERCHPLTRPRIPSLVRIGWVLPDLFRKLCNMLSITAHPSLQRPFPITENQTVTKDGYHYSDNSTISIRYGCVVELSYATARHRQETQLSQRDRSMLRDTEYFALNHSSLKDIQNHILE